MEREHLIIIALILVALYMMNKDTKDTVQGMGPASRIRYEERCKDGTPAPCYDNPLSTSTHIRTRREGFKPIVEDQDPNEIINPANAGTVGPGSFHIRYNDKYIAKSQHIKNHIRHGNRNASFKGLMEGGCGSEPEPFRFTTCPPGTPPQDCPPEYP